MELIVQSLLFQVGEKLHAPTQQRFPIVSINIRYHVAVSIHVIVKCQGEQFEVVQFLITLRRLAGSLRRWKERRSHQGRHGDGIAAARQRRLGMKMKTIAMMGHRPHAWPQVFDEGFLRWQYRNIQIDPFFLQLRAENLAADLEKWVNRT